MGYIEHDKWAHHIENDEWALIITGSRSLDEKKKSLDSMYNTK